MDKKKPTYDSKIDTLLFAKKGKFFQFQWLLYQSRFF